MNRAWALFLLIFPVISACSQVSGRVSQEAIISSVQSLFQEKPTEPEKNPLELPRPRTDANTPVDPGAKVSALQDYRLNRSGTIRPGLQPESDGLWGTGSWRTDVAVGAVMLCLPAAVVLIVLVILLGRKGARKSASAGVPEIHSMDHPEYWSDLAESTEQERWSLPGFQGVQSPVPDIDAGRLDFVSRGSSGLFNFRLYNYDSADDFDSTEGLFAAGRALLEHLSGIFYNAEFTLLLRDAAGTLTPVLARRGDLYVTGDELSAFAFVPEILEKILTGNCVIGEDGRSIFFPLDSSGGLVGAVAVVGTESVYRPQAVSRAWVAVNRSAELIYAARVYEEAATDPETTLWNGFVFARDLRLDAARPERLGTDRAPGLMLVRFEEGTDLAQTRDVGLAFRSAFSPFACYRVAADVFACISPPLVEGELERRLVGFLEPFQGSVNVSVGYAVMSGSSADEWFRRAATAVEESYRAGPNRYSFHGSAAR